jgi:hypothetical protein
MQSTAERKEEEARRKLEQLEKQRLSRFESGLESIPDLDFEKVEGDPDSLLAKFKRDSDKDLKEIMAEAEKRRPKDELGGDA